MKVLFWLDAKIGQVENVLVTIFLTSMILVAFLQIVLRNFFSTGIDWGDSLVRYLVVWVAFIGAAIATKEGKHITIDILSRWFSGPGRIAMQAVTDLFSVVICGLLTLAGVHFINFEAQMGGTVFFRLPVWVPEIIIPITFALMTLRFALNFLNGFVSILARTYRK
jgi:TRAP-type C4-dicarboxylate transport system permease small subunit